MVIEMSPIDILRILCIRIGKYQDMSKLRFIRRFIINKKIFKLFNTFLNLDIFIQSDALGSMLISLFGRNREIMPDDLKEILRVTEVSIEIFSEHTHYSYMLNTAQFEIDTMINSASGTRFNYYKGIKAPSQIEKIWKSLIPELESIYMKIIYKVADILNNPSINDPSINQDPKIDPFID